MGIYRILNVLSAIYYGAGCHIDKALEIEARYFVDTLFSKETKNIIGLPSCLSTMQRQIKAKGYENATFKSGCHRAGMMGAGIAYVNAKAGIDVVLKDVSLKSRGGRLCENTRTEKLENGLQLKLK
jgi:3-hydroxyacyl-CoA dehydrogenase/enoyl-CoA hydratase/3-hydroxybutyryl-CoA epimerase